MSAIDDTRKLLQDFLAPEIREVKTRLEALEKRVEEGFAQIEKQFAQTEKLAQERFAQTEKLAQERFAQAERVAEMRHQALLAALQALTNWNELRDRLTRLESRESELMSLGSGRPGAAQPPVSAHP